MANRADTRTAGGDPVLHQFAGSHYNEKVRWALDWRGIPHRRVTWLPGLHAGAMRRLSGQPSTPVLQVGGKAIPGSAAIIEHLERTHADHPLYPAQPTQRSSALAWQQQWDLQVGPATRTLFFAAALGDLEHISALFAQHKRPLTRRLYRATLGMVRPVMARANRADDPAAITAARTTVLRALDDLAPRINEHDQLVGPSFTVADLACAALLLPIVDTDHPLLAPPTAPPAPVTALRAGFADHPAVAWARRQYERHRPRTTSAR